jgi:hypothetical protein
MLHIVMLHLVSMTLVNVNHFLVKLNVLLVTKTTNVLPVKTQPKELLQVVNAHLVGKMLLTVLIVSKNHIQKVLMI